MARTRASAGGAHRWQEPRSAATVDRPHASKRRLETEATAKHEVPIPSGGASPSSDPGRRPPILDPRRTGTRIEPVARAHRCGKAGRLSQTLVDPRRRIEPVGTHRRDNLNRPVGFSDAPEVATDSNRPSTQTAIRIRTRAVPWPDRVARRSPDRSEAATAPPRRRDRTPAPLR